MKSKLTIIICIIAFNFSFSQVKMSKREDISNINRNWRLVKTSAGTYGIMDKNGKTISKPIYSKIYKFGEYSNDLALVKNASGTYGFINRSGNEIIPSQYELEYIKINFSSLYKKYIK